MIYNHKRCTFLVYVVVLVTTVCGYCPNGWIRYSNSCYLFEDIVEDWNTSRAYCQGFNGDLVVPETPQENNFIKSHLGKIYHDCSKRSAYYWFGMNDQAVEGEWVWATSGDPLPYTDWAPKEPSNGHGGNCGAYFGNTGFTWDDFGCSAKRLFICEYQDPIEVDIIGK